MALASAINYAHSAAPDFFQDLIIPDPPIGIADVDFIEHFLESFRTLDVREGALQQTIQTKTAPNTRCRSTFLAGRDIILHSHGIESIARVHT
jgi:hypothetical protein